jgi:hypothetical protein
MNSASLCSLAGRYYKPIPTRFLAPLDCLKNPAQDSFFHNSCSSGKLIKMTVGWRRQRAMPDFWVFDHPRPGWVGLSPKLERVSNCMCGSMEGGGWVGRNGDQKVPNWAWRKSKDNARWRMAICRVVVFSVYYDLYTAASRQGRIQFSFTEIKILRSSMDEISCRTDYDTVKKGLAIFPSPAGMSQTRLSLCGNN